MDNLLEPCRLLVAALVTAPDPEALLPRVWPCPPLDILIMLHQEITRTMLVDLRHAQRAAAASRAIARHFPQDPLLQAQAQWSSGSAILYVPDYPRALEHFDAALDWYERACQAHSPDVPPRDVRVVQIMRVFCLSELGRYTEAKEAVDAAERWLAEHPNEYAQLTLLLNRSQLAGAMGDYLQMVELSDAIIKVATSLDELARASQGWVNRAYACIYLGLYGEADVALDRALAIAAEADEPVTTARALCNRSWLLHCQGHLFASLTVLREAQQGLTQAEGELATTTLEEAAIYEQLRQLPEALRAARYAAEQFARQLMPAYSADAALRAVRYASELRQFGTASDLLKMARAQADRAGLPVLNAQIELAEATLAILPRPDLSSRRLSSIRKAARAAAHHAVSVLETHGLAQEIVAGQLTIAALNVQLGARDAALAAYYCLAQHPIHHIQLTANAAIGALLPAAEAVPYLQRAAMLAVEQRRTLPMEELQARYSSETSRYHIELAACYLALDDVTRSFEAVCGAKAGPLLDLRAASSRLDAASRSVVEVVKSDIARQREQLHELLRKAQHTVQQGQHEAATYHYQQAQAQAEAVLLSEQKLTATLRTLGDRYGAAAVPSMVEIQSALAPTEALLEYIQIGEDLGCFLVRPRQPVVYRRLGPYATLAPLLDRWSLVARRLMDDQSFSQAHQQIRRVLTPLWNMLIAPWDDDLIDVATLLIAPHGILHHVPWAALWSGEVYLSDRFLLMLTPCGALWAATPLQPVSSSLDPPRLLSHAGQGERYLTHIAEEITSIVKHVPGAQVITSATAMDIRAAPPPRLLHIAAHGLTNPAAPLCSTLELADGPFLLLEAHRLDLRGTELVTLSACETSVRPDHGDMALALAGAFLCAGAHAVLASLWQVSDSATAALMDHFYAGLSNDMSPPAALRQVQLRAREHNPLDWAAFQIWCGAQ